MDESMGENVGMKDILSGDWGGEKKLKAKGEGNRRVGRRQKITSFLAWGRVGPLRSQIRQ